MMTLLFEFGLSFIDYSYLLYFYLCFMEIKWKWKKALLSIIFISLIQLSKDIMFDFGGFSVFIDIFLVSGFLFLYAKPYTIDRFLCALMLCSLFNFTVTLFVSLAIELSFDINSTLIFGLNRMIFSLILKVFTIFVLAISMKPFKALKEIMVPEMLNTMILIISFTLFGLSYVYGNSVGNESILIYTLFLSIIISFVYVLFYRYCIIMKKEANYELMNNMMFLTSKHIQEVEHEHEHLRKVRHDYKNQLSVISELLKEKRYQEIAENVASLTQQLETEVISISGNTYIDAVLRQKMAQYNDIEFKLNISISSSFHFDGTSLISLLSNIIDNACEELYRIHEKSFSLRIIGSESQLCIVEKNKCRKDSNRNTDKDKRMHGYGLKIIEEIVRKNKGDLQIEIDDYFVIKVIIFL